jgi:hypothetical protein
MVMVLLSSLKFLFSLFLRSYLRSAQCYQGKIVLVVLPFSFIQCNYSGMAQYNTKLTAAH